MGEENINQWQLDIYKRFCAARTTQEKNQIISELREKYLAQYDAVNLAQQEVKGIKVKDIVEGDHVFIETLNSLYHVKRKGEGLTIEGNRNYCPTPTDTNITGSTWGGSAIKVKFIGIGLYMEYWIRGVKIDTSAIQHIQHFSADGELKADL